MTYLINHITPAYSYSLSEEYDTLKDARTKLAFIRKFYAKAAPSGMKRDRAAWQRDRTAIICEDTTENDPQGRGDRHTYTIFKRAE